MIQNEQILEYIDGMLDPDSEQALFDALARQPELRGVMRQFICIGEAVRADREAYAPPAEVERSLMAGIGLSPAELGFVAPSVGIIERLGLLGGRYLGMIGAFILGVLLASVTVYQIVDNGDRGGVEVVGNGGARSGASQGGTASSKNGTTTNGTTADRGALTQMNGPQHQAPSGPQGNAGVREGAIPQNNGASPSNGASPNAASSNGASASATPRMSESIVDRSTPRGTRSSALGSRRTRSSQQGRGYEALSSSGRNRDGASSLREGGSVSERPNESATSRSGNMSDARRTRDDGGDARDPNARSTSPSREASAIDPSDSQERRDIAIGSVELRRSRADGRAVPMYEAIAESRSPNSVPQESTTLSSIEDTESEESLQGLLLEARGQIGWSLNGNNAKTVGSAGRNAFAAGAYWLPFRGLAIGVEGGMESYDQTLRYRNSDTLQIDQRPSYLWGGATLRYYLGALSISELSPFVQTTLGGTQAGPMLRMRLGTEYDLGINISFMLSGEFSTLFYSFDNQRLTSGRWGLSAGMQYHIR